MAITNQLNLDQLTAPVAGANPAGSPLPFGVKDQLDQMRKEIDPASYDANDPLRPTEFRKADWSGISKLAQKTLIETSKDLQVGARLVEALTKTQGFQGLGDGFELLEALIDKAWDRLMPVVDDPSDLDIRAAPFEWLDDPDRGARFPSTVGAVTLLDAIKDVPEMGFLDWKQSQTTQGGSSGKFDQLLAAANAETVVNRRELAARARETITRVEAKLAEKLKDLAPSMIHLRGALDGILGLLDQIISRKSPAAAAPSDGASSGQATGQGTAQGGAASRDQAYQMMSRAADILASIEPHSPVPYLVRRAVEMGRLPFPEMILAIVREQSVIDGMFRELGIPKKEQG
jgi:type VI secretion system protein ImpA